MSWIKALIAKYPAISMIAAAAAGYYGGPKGQEMLASVARMLGLI